MGLVVLMAAGVLVFLFYLETGHGVRYEQARIEARGRAAEWLEWARADVRTRAYRSDALRVRAGEDSSGALDVRLANEFGPAGVRRTWDAGDAAAPYRDPLLRGAMVSEWNRAGVVGAVEVRVRFPVGAVVDEAWEDLREGAPVGVATLRAGAEPWVAGPIADWTIRIGTSDPGTGIPGAGVVTVGAAPGLARPASFGRGARSADEVTMGAEPVITATTEDLWSAPAVRPIPVAAGTESRGVREWMCESSSWTFCN